MERSAFSRRPTPLKESKESPPTSRTLTSTSCTTQIWRCHRAGQWTLDRINRCTSSVLGSIGEGGDQGLQGNSPHGRRKQGRAAVAGGTGSRRRQPSQEAGRARRLVSVRTPAMRIAEAGRRAAAVAVRPCGAWWRWAEWKGRLRESKELQGRE
jgi:hypothetical protein